MNGVIAFNTIYNNGKKDDECMKVTLADSTSLRPLGIQLEASQ